MEERYLCTEVNDIKEEEEENDKFQVCFRLSYCIVDVVWDESLSTLSADVFLPWKKFRVSFRHAFDASINSKEDSKMRNFSEGMKKKKERGIQRYFEFFNLRFSLLSFSSFPRFFHFLLHFLKEKENLRCLFSVSPLNYVTQLPNNLLPSCVYICIYLATVFQDLFLIRGCRKQVAIKRTAC